MYLVQYLILFQINQEIKIKNLNSIFLVYKIRIINNKDFQETKIVVHSHIFQLNNKMITQKNKYKIIAQLNSKIQIL
ncbi:unnamed protein product [Paramecium sonneborni]|uniref:Uncharacterized protein n=1 Tax=Paramecium sonneborni TaxID=65129 RepID=A0A8S1QGX0_9CILI|nr:unnamed protein product [Paramecium sonneborni]